MTLDMRKALREAALLRNLMEGCLKGAASPMTGREIFEWPSIKEKIGTNLAAYGKLSTQLQQLVKKGQVEKIGQGINTTYAWHNGEVVKQAARVEVPRLKLRIDKAHKSLHFEFEGLAITIEVV